jgi:Mg-chelatase subunit ChlD
VPDLADQLALARWRLVLGRFADRCLGGLSGSSGPCQRTGAGGQDRGRYDRMDRVLEYLYGREYKNRGVRERKGPGGEDSASGEGGSGESLLTIPEWLHDVREIFPRETVEILERHALERYGMTDLVTDEEVLRKLEPSYELLKAVLSFRHLMSPKVLEAARLVVRQVVEDLRRRLARDVRQVLRGRLSRQRRSHLKVSRNLDFQRTIRDNLKHYDVERKRLVLQSLYFCSRVERHIPWHVIMAVDCSGSMLGSLIHSAVMAGIFHGLPTVQVSFVAFDTTAVDLTGQVEDPMEVLMSVHLGGGTDIAGALGYCETLVRSPQRTILVLVTDFFEGGSPERLIAAIKRLREAGVRVLGLAALDEPANPSYDRQMAERCVAAGAEVAALTPRRLAEWMAQVLSI